jgi:hypothetical protein
MSPRKTIKLIFIAFLIGLTAEGALIAWASPPVETDQVDVASSEPASPDSGVSAVYPAMRQPARIEFDAKVIGTAVVAGGSSIAVLQLTTGTQLVREGDEIVPGLRVVKIGRNRIDVERAGVLQEFRSIPSSGPVVGGEAIQADTVSLREPGGRNARSLFYSRQSRN